MLPAFLAGVGKAVVGKGVVGTLAKGAAGAVLGGVIDRGFDRSARADQYNFLAGKGLTPQEIAGSGFGDGRGSGAGQVLGNQLLASEQMAKQQEYDREQRELDRAVAVRGQDAGLTSAKLHADASIASSSMSAGASMYSSDTSRVIAEMNNALNTDRFVNVELPAALRDAVTKAPEWERLRIMAQMGVDNMIGTAIANKYGLNPMDPSALSNMSDSDFRKMVTEIYGLQSRIFGETAGSATIINNGFSELGRSFGGGPVRPSPRSGGSSSRLGTR